MFIPDFVSILVVLFGHKLPLQLLWIFKRCLVHRDSQQSLGHVIREFILLCCYVPNKWLTNSGGRSALLSHYRQQW